MATFGAAVYTLIRLGVATVCFSGRWTTGEGPVALVETQSSVEV